MIEVEVLVFEGDKVVIRGQEPLGDGSFGKSVAMTIPKGLLCDLIKWALADPMSILPSKPGDGSMITVSEPTTDVAGFTFADVIRDGHHIGRIVFVQASGTWGPDAKLLEHGHTGAHRWGSLDAAREAITATEGDTE